MGLDKYYSSDEYMLGDRLSEKEYLSLLTKRLSEFENSLLDYLFVNDSHGFIHTKNIDLHKNPHKKINSKLLCTNKIVTELLFEKLFHNKEEIANWALYNKRDNLKINIPCAFNCGIGIDNNTNLLYVTKTLTVILKHDLDKDLGFGIETYYPNIREDAELYEPDKFVGTPVEDLVNYFELTKDDISQLTGCLTPFEK